MFFVRAIVVALSFEFLFNLVIEIAEMFGNELLNALSLDLMLPDWGYVVEFCMTSLFSSITGIVAILLLILLKPIFFSYLPSFHF